MATYINGVTDYIPKLQPFQPDLNFYNTVLQTKEAQYQEGYQKISNLYGTLLNSEMLREPDIKKRDEFFKQINQEIQKMSMVDLSMPQNISAARKVFQPLIDDKNIVSDMALTKRYRSEQGLAESLRRCQGMKKKDCYGYWSEGVDNLEYWRQDYQRTTNDEALNFSAPRYVPQVNISERAGSLIKDNKFKIVDTYVSGDRKWIVEQTNGTLMTLPLTEYLMSTVGSDGAVADMYRVIAENDRHRYINSNVDKFGGDYGAAEDAYNREQQSKFDKIKQDRENLEKDKNLIQAKKATVAQQINQATNGVSQNSPFYNALKVLIDEDNAAQTAISQADEAVQGIERTGIFTGDRLAKRGEIDGINAYYKMRQGMFEVANTYSQLTSEKKMKANPYTVEATKHANRVSLAMLKQKLDLQKEEYKFGKKKELLQMQGKIPTFKGNTYQTNTGAAGGGATPELNELRQEFASQAKFRNDGNVIRTEAVKTFYTNLANAADYEKDDVKRQYAAAQLDAMGFKKGSDGTYSTGQIKDPLAYYQKVKSLTADPIFNTHFGSISSDLSDDINQVNKYEQAISSYHKKTKNNIASLYNYLETYTGKASKDDIVRMKAVIDDETGNTRSAADVQKRLAKSNVFVDIDDAQDIVDEYSEMFMKHYSAGYTKGSGKDVSPVVTPYDWRPGMPINSGGLAAYPISARIGVNPNDMNQATIDALTMYDFVRNNASSENYKVYSGNVVTKDMLDDGIKPEDNSDKVRFLNYALNTMAKEASAGKIKDNKLSAGMDITLHPITGNDNNLRGVSFNIPEPLFNEWKKDGKVTGVSYSDFANLTVVMPKDRAPSQVFDQFEAKPVKAILRSGGAVNISYPEGGNIKISGNDDGTYTVGGEIFYYNQNGDKVSTREATRANPSTDPDYIYQMINGKLKSLSYENFKRKLDPNNPKNAGSMRSADEVEALIRSFEMQMLPQE
jgi:hypothetical protein